MAMNTQSISQGVYTKKPKHKYRGYKMKQTLYIGYGKLNKGVVTKESSWKSLNGGKRLTKSQMRLLQIKRHYTQEDRHDLRLYDVRRFN